MLESWEVMPRQRIWTLIFVGFAIAALMLLASSLSGLTFRPGQFYDFNARMPPMDARAGALPIDPASLAFWQMLVSIVSLALLVYVVLGLILSRKFRRELLRRVISVLIAILLFNLLISALRRNLAQEQRSPVGTNAPLTAPQAGEPFPSFVANPAPWLIIVISVILAALLIGAIWFLWRRMRAQAPPLVRLADEAQVALTGLQAGSDLKDTVLRCYREMSQILSEQRGIARPRDMTAREFEQRLAAVGLRDEHVRQLTRLFERVRYGARQASEREEREAIACLTAIVQAYGRAP
jgi:Domain of unknown function (DUF4129)